MAHDPTDPRRHGPVRGRGAVSSPVGRFESLARQSEHDGWEIAPGPGADQEAARRPVVFVRPEAARSILTRNDSPDIPFELSVNPYRGCQHGCVYCFARPSHAYLGLSPGLDFETRISAKTNAPELLRRELGARAYVCKPITLGINTDAYQPAEKRLRLTRAIVEVLAECRHPFSVITKGSLIERDLDLLAPMAQRGLFRACVSITNLDEQLARHLEPQAASPARRIETIRRLTQAGIPVGVMVAPVIPWLTDRFLEQTLARAREAGARTAGYGLLRLPHEVAPIFKDWLLARHPLKAEHVMSLIRQMRGGRENDSRFGRRHSGEGIHAELIRQRFELAVRRLGFSRGEPALDTGQFVPPAGDDPQMALF